VGEGVAEDSGDGSSAVLVRRHTKLGGGSLVETAAGAVACVVHGTCDRVPGLQVALELVHAAGVGIGTWCDSEHRLERPL
jgi:hypothetical protein